MAIKRAEEVHKVIREKRGLPSIPPTAKDGVECNICVNNCRIGVD